VTLSTPKSFAAPFWLSNFGNLSPIGGGCCYAVISSRSWTTEKGRQTILRYSTSLVMRLRWLATRLLSTRLRPDQADESLLALSRIIPKVSRIQQTIERASLGSYFHSPVAASSCSPMRTNWGPERLATKPLARGSEIPRQAPQVQPIIQFPGIA